MVLHFQEVAMVNVHLARALLGYRCPLEVVRREASSKLLPQFEFNNVFALRKRPPQSHSAVEPLTTTLQHSLFVLATLACCNIFDMTLLPD
eukprot:4973849-Amphidinium_carterae.1